MLGTILFSLIGRRDCKGGKFCPKLTQKPGVDIAWRCQSGINPYKEDIPMDTPCYAQQEQFLIFFLFSKFHFINSYLFSCPSWRNSAGEIVVAKSTCQFDGSWSDPKAYPPGTMKYPAKLNKPDSEMMGCGCHSLNITYNPNTEEGAEFYCEDEIKWDNLPQKIETTNKCSLFCDKESY